MSKYLNSPKDADWFACPSCGAEVRVGSAGCARCRGMDPDSEGDPPAGELPEDPEDFDYDDFVRREFGASGRVKPAHIPWKYWVAGVVLLGALVWGWALRFLF